MKLKLDDPETFTKAIDLISELVIEVRIKINELGLSIVATDPGNFLMVSLRVPRPSFSEFEAGEETLGVNLEDFKKILRRAKKGSSLILQKNENNLEIKIEDKVKRVFNLNLIEVEGEEREFPDHLEFSSTVEINTSELSDAIEDSAVVGDACSFIVFEGKFIVEAKETNSARAEFSEGLKVEGENCESRYGIEYLQTFLKAQKFFPDVKLHLGNSHPIKFVFSSEKLNLAFLLAPRVETED